MWTGVLILGLLLLTLPGPGTAQDPQQPAEIPEQPDCPVGYFNVNCTGVCHCLNGPDVCDLVEGYCTDYQCDRGWTDTPYCQTECEEGYFGSNCQLECHCPEGDTCDRINGLCGNFTCHVDWTGPGCQIRLPKLIDAPQVINISCTQFGLTWVSWVFGYDIGDYDVGSYTIQQSVNLTAFQDVLEVPHTAEGVRVVETFQNVDPYTLYEFRLVTNRVEFGKTMRGLAGPHSTLVKPLSSCFEETTPSPVVTTTVETTTDDDTTTRESTTLHVTTDSVTSSPAPLTSTSVVTTTLGPSTAQTTAAATTPRPQVPGPVDDLDITIRGDDVIITWTPPTNVDGDLLGYNLTYQKVATGDCDVTSAGPVTVVSLDADEGRYEVIDLDSWSEYRLTFAAINTVGEGAVVTKNVMTREIAPTGTVNNLAHRDLSTTGVTITWGDVTCAERGGELESYEVIVLDGDNDEVSRKNIEEMMTVVTGLQPHTQYVIHVTYVNDVDKGPSATYNIRTEQSIPSAPTQVKVISETSFTMTVTWSEPSPANGVITRYRISYKADTEDGERLVTHTDLNDLQRQLNNLEPYTVYNIRVQAQTQATINQGWGNFSTPVSHRTFDGQPSQPRDLERDFKNQSCIGIRWAAPLTPNGIMTNYVIQYKLTATNDDEVEDEIDQSQTRYLACSLRPAAQYRFQVAARTRGALGDPSDTLDLWTGILVPDVPPRPVVKAVTGKTVTVTIQPVVLSGGPLSAYFMVVSDVDSARRKRASFDPTKTIPLPGYTAAELAPNDVRTTRNFTLGDNQTYNGYKNVELQPETRYTIYYVVASSLDGDTKTAFSQTASSVTTTVYKPVPVAKSDDDDTVMIVIIVVVIIALIILIIIAVLLFLYCRKRGKAESYTDEKKDTWLTYYTNNFYDTMPRSQFGNWSDIYDLEEPRHVVLHDNYNPDDLKVADIHHGRPRISFEEEYKRLPQGKTASWKAALKQNSKHNNHFNHILPYDHSRVVLKDRRGRDYINASYINGYNKPDNYIAAQSPYNYHTMEDFWYMVFTEKISQIVFMARLIEDSTVKSEQYWPESGAQEYGDVLVSHVKTEPFANFNVRTFTLTRNGVERRVTQFHFIGWPDHGVPNDPIPFLEFVMKVKSSIHGGNGPVVVHCGTGVSRSSVFIAVDSLLEQAKLENIVNVYKFCRAMRTRRIFMVRTLKQYIFIYDTMFEALLTNHNMVGEDLKVTYRILSRVNPVNDKSYFREQFETLEEFVPTIESQCNAARMEANSKKNRFKTILPPDCHRVVIETPGGVDRNDYINALYLDSYTQQKAFIVTQTPLESTVIDFWKMVYDKKVNTIVMMNGSQFKEDTCAQYWPSTKAMQKYEPFFVSLVSMSQEEHVTTRVFKLANALKPSEPSREITQFQFESWKMYEKIPWSREALIQLTETVENWRQSSSSYTSPVVVHCMDGASQSGLFCAAAILCEKLEIEEEVDVFHTIKHLKKRRPHFINSLEQYKFCFKLLWDFMNTRMWRHRRRQANGVVPAAPEFDV